MSQARQPFPDLVRACALFGIALVNVDYFAHATTGGVIAAGWGGPADRVLWWAVVSLFLLKSYSLFALMFGVGVAQQMRSAAGDGVGFGGRYARRLTGLLGLGLINAALLFYGDILVVYALLGSSLYLFRHLGAAALRRWAIGLYLVQAAAVLSLWLSALAFSLPDGTPALREALAASAQDTAQRVAGFAAPGVLAVAATRFEAWATDLVWMVTLQGFGALAFMLYGLYMARSGLLEDLASLRWVRARRIDLPFGLALAAVGSWLMVGSDHEFDLSFLAGSTLIVLGSPFSTTGYLGLVAAWSQRPPSWLRDFLARAGGGSLTAYLMQGLLLSLVFSGYGLGLVGQLGAAAYIPIGAAAAVLSLLFIGWWRGRHALGPVETLLRRWVYLGERRGSGQSDPRSPVRGSHRL